MPRFLVVTRFVVVQELVVDILDEVDDADICHDLATQTAAQVDYCEADAEAAFGDDMQIGEVLTVGHCPGGEPDNMTWYECEVSDLKCDVEGCPDVQVEPA
jgi:hypothetical protein